MGARRITQALAALAINPYFSYFSSRAIYQGGLKKVCIPGLNCYACPLTVFSCPIGSLQHSFRLLSGRLSGAKEQVVKGLSALMYVLGSVGLVGTVVGRMPCGWICPFGLLQDLLYKIPVPKMELPRLIRRGRYLVLVALVIVAPLFTGVSWFSRLCPVGSLEGGVVLKLAPPTGGLPTAGWFFWFKVAILVGFLVWFMFSKRPFCRAACPLGAVLGLCNPLSFYRLEVDEDRCDACGKCRRVCPVDIDIFADPDSPECIRCLECRRACPRGAISAGFARGRQEKAGRWSEG